MSMQTQMLSTKDAELEGAKEEVQFSLGSFAIYCSLLG